MTFDPRCVAFEGRLHADRWTAEYVGRARHDEDAACFRSSRAAAASAHSQILRYYYFETQILATASTSEVGDPPLPVRINTASTPRARPHAAHDTSATRARDWRQEREVLAMDMEDVHVPALESDPQTPVPVNFNISFHSRTIQELRSRMDRHRVRRRAEKKKFNHKIAVGFLLDVSNGQSSNGSTSRENLEAKMSRQAVKELMQRILPSGATDDEEREDVKAWKTTAPPILHQDLGEMVHSLAYVGKSGRVVSHGRACLQCEKYGAGDVVGCGVLFDTKTFFFTLNGKLVGMIAARDVYNLDTFREEEEEEEEEGEEGEEDEVIENSDDNDDQERDKEDENVEMEEIEDDEIDGKVLYASVSLHGPGECIRGVFEPEKFEFDLASFELEIQKDRQRALLAEQRRRKKETTVTAMEDGQDVEDATLHTLVHDFFLYYGYENASKALESTVGGEPWKRSCGALNGEKPRAVNVEAMMEEEETKEERDTALHGNSVASQAMRQSLRLRHQVRDHIRCYRSAQALEILEQHAATCLSLGNSSRRLRKLLRSCRILCVMDTLQDEEETKASPNGAFKCNQEIRGNGWHPEAAIEVARELFGSHSTTNGKRKRREAALSSWEDVDDVTLAMSLLLYDQIENIPDSSRAKKFLLTSFRESVAEELNLCFLMGEEEYGKKEAPVSLLETFLRDLETVQEACLRRGGRVYPEQKEKSSPSKWQNTSQRQWNVALSLSSDESSASPSEQEDDDDEDDDDEE